MLVLSRKPGERIVIADVVSVEIVRLGDGCVRLGITAPEEIEVLRGELFDARAGISAARADAQGGERA